MIADELNEENKNRQAMEQEIFNEAISLIEKNLILRIRKL